MDNTPQGFTRWQWILPRPARIRSRHAGQRRSRQDQKHDTYPDEIVLAVWEELAARGLVVDFIEQSPLLRETQADDLLTVATFRNYVHAQLAQTRLLASGILAFLFDDNTIRMNWFWATAPT